MEQGQPSLVGLYLSSEYVGSGGSVELHPGLTIVYTAPGSSQTSVLIKRLGAESADVFDAIIREAGANNNLGDNPDLSAGVLN